MVAGVFVAAMAGAVLNSLGVGRSVTGAFAAASVREHLVKQTVACGCKRIRSGVLPQWLVKVKGQVVVILKLFWRDVFARFIRACPVDEHGFVFLQGKIAF